MTNEDERRNRARSRISLLCSECKRRKVKCDRSLPCLSCIKHQCTKQCTYFGDQVFTHDNASMSGMTVLRGFNTQSKPSTNSGTPKSGESTFSVSSKRHKPSPPKFDEPSSKYHESPSDVAAELGRLKSKLHALEASMETAQAAPQPSAPLPLMQPFQKYEYPSPVPQMNTQFKPTPSLSPHPNFLNGDWSMRPMPGNVALNPPMSLPVPGPIKPIASPPRTTYPNIMNGKTNANLSWIGMNPYDLLNAGAEFDIYSGYDPIFTALKGRMLNHGPFSWYAFVQKDLSLRTLWNFANGQQYNVLTRTKCHVHQGPKSNDVEDVIASVNKRGLALGLTVFGGDVDKSLRLIEKIMLMLPTQKAVHLLLERFFNTVYPYLPFVDETHFRKSITRILGPLNELTCNEAYSRLNILKTYDFATMALLLVILRFTYLSLFSNDQTENEHILAPSDESLMSDLRYLFTNPVNMDTIRVAQLCIDQYDVQHRTNITVLQAMIALRLYLSISPESTSGIDGLEADMSNGICIQISYCMGLYRDPSIIHSPPPSPEYQNMCRKLWLYVRMMDTKLSFHFGLPLMLDDSCNETSLPYYTMSDPLSRRDKIEKSLCDFFAVAGSIYDSFRLIMKKCTPLRDKLKLVELSELITRLELQVSSILGTLSSFVQPASSEDYLAYRGVLFCKLYLQVKSFLMSIFYHLFLNYEKAGKHELAFFYLRKFIAFSIGEFLVEVDNLITKQRQIFDQNSEIPSLILNPSIVYMTHKVSQMNLALLIRLNRLKAVRMMDGPIHESKVATSVPYNLYHTRLCKLIKTISHILKYCVSCLTRLNHRYFYAWKLSKTHANLFETISTLEFQKYTHESSPPTIQFTLDQIIALLEITETAKSKIRELTGPGREGSMPNHGANSPVVTNEMKRESPARPEFDLNGIFQTPSNDSSAVSLTSEVFFPNGVTAMDEVWQQLLEVRQSNERGPHAEIPQGQPEHDIMEEMAYHQYYPFTPLGATGAADLNLGGGAGTYIP